MDTYCVRSAANKFYIMKLDPKSSTYYDIAETEVEYYAHLIAEALIYNELSSSKDRAS